MKRHPFISIINILLIIITILFAIGMFLIYFTGQINPNTEWRLAYLGLLTPVIIVINVLLFLFWCIRWHYLALIPLIALLINTEIIGKYFQPSIFKTYNTESSLKIMTYNVRKFSDQDMKSSLDSVIAVINQEKPDLLCIQEFASTIYHPADSISLSLKTLPYKKIFYTENYGTNIGFGLAIYSKYPLLKSGTLLTDSTTGGTLYCDLVIKEDTLRVFNNHLQTSHVNGEDKAFLTYDSLLNSNMLLKTQFEKIKQIAKKLKGNNRKRAIQADSIAQLINTSPYPVIICGDFNDIPASYTYNTIRGQLNDAFVEKGRGYGYSYNGLYKFLRIDYILSESPLKCTDYHSPDIPYSDHNPVIADFIFQK